MKGDTHITVATPFPFFAKKATVGGHMFLRFCVKLTLYMSITDIFTL